MKRGFTLIGGVVLVGLVCVGVGAAAPRSVAARSGSLAPAGVVTLDRPAVVDLRTAGDFLAPAAPLDALVDRPAMPLEQYRAAKTAAAAAASSQLGPLSANTLQGHAALSVENGAGEGNVFPAGIDGAVGSTQVVTVTNSHISVYTKAPSRPRLLLQKTLNALVGFDNSQLFDPRIEYDARSNRWVFVGDSYDDTDRLAPKMWLWLAVSQSPDATGAWFVYRYQFGSPFINAYYPQVGLSQDAAILTWWTSADDGEEQVLTTGISKAVIYNGQAGSFPEFVLNKIGTCCGGSAGIATPPNVLDSNSRVHELLVVPGDKVYDVVFQNPGANSASIVPKTPVVGVDATLPPAAAQPGACGVPSCLIDTGDSRFSSDLTQYGTELWAVNTVGVGGRPTVHWYDIWAEGPQKNTVRQDGLLHATPTSQDFSASIVAREQGRAMLTWSYTDPANGINPSMAMTGRLPTDLVGTMNQATTVFTSPHNLQGNYVGSLGAQAWSATSSIRYDPGTARTFGFNETVGPLGAAWQTHQGVLSLG